MPGYQEGSEPRWWWKVAMHLDEAQLSLVNAIAHNVDDSTAALAVHDLLREAQTVLLTIFAAKGLLPGVVPMSPVEADGSAAVTRQVPDISVMDEPPVSAALKAEAYEAAVADEVQG